jgi:hypothetical protein
MHIVECYGRKSAVEQQSTGKNMRIMTKLVTGRWLDMKPEQRGVTSRRGH